MWQALAGQAMEAATGGTSSAEGGSINTKSGGIQFGNYASAGARVSDSTGLDLSNPQTMLIAAVVVLVIGAVMLKGGRRR